MRRAQCIATALAAFVFLSSAAIAQERRAQARRENDLREEGKLKPGNVAPDFSLKTLDGKKTIKLSSFTGKKPVALVFGSYT
jgi:hypothetical protein